MAGNIFVREQAYERREVEEPNGDVNTRLSFVWDSEVHESWSPTKGHLFKQMQKEYGRCTGYVYMYRQQGKRPRKIGWVFEKRVRYTDSDKTYIQETWVTLHKREPKKSIKYYYR